MLTRHRVHPADPRKMMTVTQPTKLPRFTFVVTYGRSGSTLVQGLLNAMPGGLVRGENNLFVLPLFRSWSALRDFNKKYAGLAGERGVQSAFYGIDEFRPHDYADSVRDLVLPQLYGATDPAEVDILGFKEVLWHRIRPKETAAFFEFFDTVFPDAQYVLHRRDHEAVTTSGFWRKQDPDSVTRALLRVETIQDRLRESRPERTHDTRYERITSDDPAVVDEELRGLAEFVLGSCDEALLARLRETLAVGFGPNPFGRSKRERKGGADKPGRPGRAGRRGVPGRKLRQARRRARRSRRADDGDG
jgi:hypothetical protein